MELKDAVEKQELGTFLLSLINNAPGMVYRGHPDWSLSFIGAEVEQVTGYSAEEFTSGAARWKAIIHPDDLACVKESYRKAVKERSKFLRVEYRIRHKNGDIRWVADRRQLIYDETGSFDYVDGLLLDITERKETDRRLAESEYRFRTIADLAVNGMVTADSRGNIDFFNRAAERLFGYASEEVIGNNVTMLIPERYRNAHKAGLERYLKTGETQVVGGTVELNALRKDGTEFPIELSLGTWGPREAPFFSAIVRDITKRRDWERSLEESEEKFRGIFEGSKDGILLADVESKRFVTGNRAICDMLQYSLDEIRRLGVADIHPEEDLSRVFDVFERQARQEIEVAKDLPVKRKDGSVFFADVTTNPVVISGKRYLIGNFRDVTERNKLEEEMAKTDKLESIGILAGGIAHDFNNLLTAIFGNITLAKMYANRQSEVYKRLEDSEKAAQRARDLTYQLLTFSKGGTPVKKAISLQELVKESASFVLRGSNVKCEFSFPGDLWPVEVDEGQMSQVFNNLIINGAHAMSDGGTLQVYCGNVIVDQSNLPLAKGKYSLISFMDHGTGIPKEHLSKIFDPYFTTKKKGSGLGLATSYSIVRGHRGYLMVESDPGIGTTFTIYLPASEEGKGLPCAEEERLVTGKGRILVMDDEEAVREVAQGMLETLGYSVTLAKDGTEAIEIYQVAMASGVPFDSVLMDLTIPGGMGGMEAVKRLQEIDPNVKAIVCSGYSNDTIMANFKKFGFRAVIPKPFSLQELSGTISDVLSTPS